MSRLVLSTTMTVDGVTTVGEWYVSEGEHDRASRDQFVGAAGMVMGRKTYEGLAGYWLAETGEWADQLNPMQKFVASRTIDRPLEWNSTLIEGDAAEGIETLKAELDGDLVLIGCGDFARHLLEKRLIDELRFWVHPALWGRGEHLFEGEEQVRLELIEAKTFDSGVSLLRYSRVPPGSNSVLLSAA